MKKVLVFVLAVAMLMSLAVPAAALASPGATAQKLTPILTEESSLIVKLHDTEEVLKLSEAIQNLMAEVKGKLKDACPEGFAVRYFFYVEIIGGEALVSVTFEPIAHNEIMFKQYVNGAWTELKFDVNKDDTITVYNVVEAPLAIFTK